MTKRTFKLPSYANQDRLVLMRGTGELEAAKTTLRKIGFVVFNSEVVTPSMKGFVTVNGISMTPAQVIDMAKERMK